MTLALLDDEQILQVELQLADRPRSREPQVHLEVAISPGHGRGEVILDLDYLDAAPGNEREHPPGQLRDVVRVIESDRAADEILDAREVARIVREGLLDDSTLAFHRGRDDDRPAVVPHLVQEPAHCHDARPERVGDGGEQLRELGIGLEAKRAKPADAAPERGVEARVDLVQIVGARPEVARGDHEPDGTDAGGARHEGRLDRLVTRRDIAPLEESLAQAGDFRAARLVALLGRGRRRWSVGQIEKASRGAPGSEEGSHDDRTPEQERGVAALASCHGTPLRAPGDMGARADVVRIANHRIAERAADR
jgi:hypothetical protein